MNDLQEPTRRAIVCGGRDYQNRERVFETLDWLHAERRISMIIEGGASGADRLARRWAEFRGVECHTEHADWITHGRAAGPIRNRKMLELEPDLLICFPGGRGTADIKRAALEFGILVNEIADETGVITSTWSVS